MHIEIDPNSGFCFGVVNAIQRAEQELQQDETLYCIGDIVHNSKEVERLEKLGLISIDHDQFANLSDCKVLLRAHGEPPSTYEIAKNRGIRIIDASCPVVLNLQKRIKKAYLKDLHNNTQIVIYGKKGHAEVNGLVGQTNGSAIVVENLNDVEKIDMDRSIILFSQTTKTINGFQELISILKQKCKKELKINDTICRKVANRVPQLLEFAKSHDVIIFVSGKKSSNGKLLYDICKQANPNSYFVSEPQELLLPWVKDAQSVGICGATSTPSWLMEEIAKNIKLQTR